MKKFIKSKTFAYVLMALAFSHYLPKFDNLPAGVEKFVGLVFAGILLSAGFTIYSNDLKREILGEVKKQISR